MAHLSSYCQLEALSVERRHAIRYELEVPAIFFWENADGSKCQGEGVTRDISEIGAYVFAANCPPLESKVRVEIMLAQPGIASASLKGRMQVMRVEDSREKSESWGFALAGKTFSLNGPARA